MLQKIALNSIYESLLSKFPQHFSFAFAYGSGVFIQNNSSQPKGTMIDFIIAVDDPLSWHRANLLQNRKHYSLLKVGGAQFIENIQQNYGAKIYFNTLIPVEDKFIKYGVISTNHLIEDLLDWQTLYVSGRMHKPVVTVHATKNEDLNQAIKLNLQSALHTALLCLPENFSEEQLFTKIAGLSYSGDFRMYIGEDKRKVQNIVKPQMNCFRKLYENSLKSMPLLHWKQNQGDLEQDCSPSSILYHLNLLPKSVQRNLLVRCNKDGRHRDVEEVFQALAHDTEYGEMVYDAVRAVVWWPSITQTCKGFFTAGFLKSLKYSSKKLVKMFKSLY